MPCPYLIAYERGNWIVHFGMASLHSEVDINLLQSIFL